MAEEKTELPSRGFRKHPEGAGRSKTRLYSRAAMLRLGLRSDRRCAEATRTAFHRRCRGIVAVSALLVLVGLASASPVVPKTSLGLCEQRRLAL
jgi:hypothetical protein